RDGVYRRDSADGDVAVQHANRAADRSTGNARHRPRYVRILDVSDGRPDQPSELYRTAGAAGGSRRFTDVLLPAGQHDSTRLSAAGQARERLGSLWPDP